MTAILCHIGPDDVFSDTFRETLVAAAGVEREALVEIRHLAEQVLAPKLAELAALTTGECWIGCRRPRAIRALLARAGILLEQAPVHWLTETSDAPSPVGTPPGRPWYPVIDHDRCRACDQCRQFCLFGVYGKDKTGRVAVEHPLNCKPGCPACARLCPAQAIIFPFCPETPINGDEPSSDTPPPTPLSFQQLAARRRGAVSREAIDAALAARAAKPDN